MDITKNDAKINEYRERAKELVSKMTLEEKVSQTLYKAVAIDRLGIPQYNWWNEALHGVARAGVATVFPQAIGLAASFDEDLLEEVADAISTEGRAKFNMQSSHEDRDIYKGLTFWAPNVNIFRDPRWGRGHETYGEDPYLTSRLGARFVEGIQGHDEKYMKAAACAKHFAVHSGPEELRHEFNAEASLQDMYETYLPAFKTLVEEAKVETVMGAYNRTNGEPCCGSKTLLQDILRDEWGFKGHVVSDCWAIRDFHENHKVTDTAVDSASLAMNNGCDLNCGEIYENLFAAVKAGKVDEKRLDEAVINLFTTRMKLGVMDLKENNPYDEIGYDAIDTKEMKALNLKASKKTIVLLKNDGVLPLDTKKINTIGVIGPNANSRNALVGNYEGTASRYVTVLEGIQDYVKDEVRVMTSEGCHLYKDRSQGLGEAKDRLAEVRGVCECSDVIIACMGLDATIEGEQGDAGNEYGSGDKPNLNFPGLQKEVMEIIASYNKPTVLVVLAGSAMALDFADKNMNAVIDGFYPGAQGGKAIADIIFGETNPEGRLPLTFYSENNTLPEFTDYSMKNRTYRYIKEKPLYPFGYGLSYTTYAYDDIKVSKDTLDDDGIDITFNVANAGNMDGVETVQFYVTPKKLENTKNVPNTSLKGIMKVSLKKGETKTITKHLPIEAFGLFNENGKLVVNKGEYEISVGGCGPDERSEELMKKPTLKVKVCY